MRSALPVLALLSTACGPTARLDALQNLRIHVSAVASTDQVSDPPDEFKVQLAYDGACVTLAGTARGTVNGEAAPKWDAGAGTSEYDVINGFHQVCREPSFHLPLAAADADQVTVAFEDGSTRVAATYLNLGRVQSLTVTPPADGHLRAGSTIGLTWAPDTDDITAASWWFISDTAGEVVDFSQRTGTSVQYTIPLTQAPGPASIEVQGQRSPGVSACDGAVSCTVEPLWLSGQNIPPVFTAVRVDLTIEP